MVYRDDPATTRQKNYAATLGIEFSNEVTHGELSDKITAAKQAAKPSDKQVEFAKNLGIKFDPDTITAPELSALLDSEVGRRSRAAMQANPALRAGKKIMYKDNPYEIFFIGSRKHGSKKRWVADLRPCYKGRGRAVTVMIITIEDAEAIELAPKRS